VDRPAAADRPGHAGGADGVQRADHDPACRTHERPVVRAPDSQRRRGRPREPYVEAARALGARDGRIILHYILPNIMHIVIYSATVTLGAVILITASLGSLGYGVPRLRQTLARCSAARG